MGKKKGFTLIELLVVIAIIALLMSILMPALARVRNQAKDVVCRSNVKQLALGFAMFVDNHNGNFNDGWISASKGGISDPWPYDILPYYGDVKLLLCPMANKYKGQPKGYYGQTFGAWSYEGIVGDPAYGAIYDRGLGPEDGYGDGSYGVNEWVSNAPQVTTDWLSGWNPPSGWWRSPNVKGADNIPLIADATYPGGYVKSGINKPQVHPSEPAAAMGGDFIKGHCIDRHNKSINCSFVDFSVRKVGLKELWTFEWFRGDNYRTNRYVIGFYGGGPTGRAECAAYWDKEASWMKNMKEY